MYIEGRPVGPRHSGGAQSLQQLRARDLEVLRWTGEQYAARVDHVAALIGLGISSAELVMRRLQHLGYAERRRYLVGEPQWMFATQHGLSMAGLAFREVAPSVHKLAHLAAVNEVRLYIQGRSPDTQWVAERQLMSEFRKAAGRPDGIAILDGRQVAIEVELVPKGHTITGAIVAERERRYDAVLYFCAPATVRLMTQLVASGRFPSLELRHLAELGKGEQR
jgi:hypothetical protein